MRRRWRAGGLAGLAMAVAIAALAPAVVAQPASDPRPLRFADATEEARFHALTATLRCVQCQNQSLADSNAQIAHDLRREVLALMRRGMSDARIEQYLVDRYGEFVLYQPRVESRTWLLWFGPLALLVVGAGVAAAWLHRRDRPPVPLPDEDQEW